MKKAKHGQGGCLSTSWQGIAGRARNDEQKWRGALHSENNAMTSQKEKQHCIANATTMTCKY
ncbi:MAG: hypothetical protein ACRC9X_02495 [Bacteroidales bacterium]